MVTRRTASRARMEKPAGRRVRIQNLECIPQGLVASRRALRQSSRNQPSVRRGNQPVLQISQPYTLDVPGQAQRLQRPDAVPVHIDLIPPEAMLSSGGVRVVIVVPALSES